MKELLDVHDEAADFFEGLAGDIVVAAPLEVESAAHPGVQIGAYRTAAAVGHGKER